MGEKREDNCETFTFRVCADELELLQVLRKERETGTASQYIRNGVNFYQDYLNYKKGFLTRMIQNDFEQCKHILRQVGAANQLLREKDLKFQTNDEEKTLPGVQLDQEKTEQ